LSTIGNQTFDHAVALGNVIVEQCDRHGKAARADYTADDGKFVLTGNAPTVYDSLGNATNGRQLTFIFDDDSIVVDTEAGSRTVTRHRVEK
jgi:lipopolysaccharide export system protein LptA